MDAKDFEAMSAFCEKAWIVNEKRIAHFRKQGREIPPALFENQKLFDMKKWTINQSSLLNRVFIAKEFEDTKENFLLAANDQHGKVFAVSILHLLTEKVMFCTTSFSLYPFGFMKLFPEHETLLREVKAKLLLYPAKGLTESIDKYLGRKSTDKKLKRLKKYDKLEGEYSSVYYLKIAKKETFMTLMKDLI